MIRRRHVRLAKALVITPASKTFSAPTCLAANEEGSVVVLFGLAVTFLFGIGAAAVDLGRQQLTTVQLQQSTDAAATSAASLTHSDGSLASATEMKTAGNRYFTLNYNGSAPAVPNTDIQGNNLVVSTQGSTITTSFVNNLGVDSLSSVGASTVPLSTPAGATDMDVVVVVQQSVLGYACADVNGPHDPDLYDDEGNLATNNSGHCNTLPELDQNHAQIKTINTLVSNILPTGSNNPNVRFGLVGYSGAVTDKWALTSDPTVAATYTSKLRSYAEDIDTTGLEAAYNMITGTNTGGTSGNQTDVTCYHRPGTPYDLWCPLVKNTTMPAPATQRDDGKPYSAVKNVIFITTNYTMADEAPCEDQYAIPARPWNNMPWYGPNFCQNYQPLKAECDKLKNAGVKVYVMNLWPQDMSPQGYEMGVQAPDYLKACASPDTDPTQPHYLETADPNVLNTYIQNTAAAIKKVRIVK